jgi:putative transcriptional regulator
LIDEQSGKKHSTQCRQALAYAKGEADVSQYRVHEPKALDVRAIRKKLGMTQEAFAQEFGLSVNTLRHWEHGKRMPEGPTRAYLLVIDRNPKAVRKAPRALSQIPACG